MTTQTYALQGLHCNACIGRVTKKLEPLAESVSVTLDPMQVVLTNPAADVAALQEAVAQAGKYQLLAPVADAVAATPSPANDGWQLEEEQKGWLATYSPLLMILGYILGAVLLVQWGHGGWAAVTLDETMRYFMAGFFLVFSFFKLLDINAFADAYTGYDLLARRWRGWALIYPFVELGLGMAYLAHLDGPLLNGITVLVMGFSAIGVIQAVTNKRRIQCACLGAVFKLPMSTVTIVEDLGMVAMALWMMAMAT
ncbi:MAG: heavy-metal-associated domain-containing protein [Pseudomonadota bacterium]